MNKGCKKYIPFTQIDLPDRKWPGNVIDKAPLKKDEPQDNK